MSSANVVSVIGNRDKHEAIVSDELGVAKETLAKMDGPLVAQLAAAIDLGLEADEISVPAIVVGERPPALDSPICVSDDRWPEFFNELRNDVLAHQQELDVLFPASQDEVLFLTNARGLSLKPKDFETIDKKTNFEVLSFVADLRVQTELDTTAVTVNRPVDFVFRGVRLTGKGQRVAVCGGPVLESHPSLRPRARIKWHRIDPESFTFGMAQAHATRVAGIIAGSGKGSAGQTPFFGLAPEADILNYAFVPFRKAAGTPTAKMSRAAAAMEAAAADRVQIVNLSWGVTRYAHQQYPEVDGTSVLCQTVDQMARFGIITVKSIGNQGELLTIPGDARAAITVGATTPTGEAMTKESGHGPTSDGRRKPELCAPAPVKAPSADSGSGFEENDGGYTSYAAPVVTGVVALMKQFAPQATPSQIQQALVESAHPLPGIDTNRQGAGLLKTVEALERLDHILA